MISAITITHNRKEFLKHAIESVVAQTLPDFEYIIVDDGSDDGTEDLVKTYADSRIRYFYFSRIAKLSALRNLGIERCQGEIITFLDSDDTWQPEYLGTVKAAFMQPQLISFISNGYTTDGSGREEILPSDLNLVRGGKLLTQKLLNDGFVIYPSCFAFRKNSGLLFNSQMRFGDNDLILRVLAHGDTIVGEKPLVTVTKHAGNMSEKQDYNSLFIQSYYEELQTLTFLREKKQISENIFRKAFAKYSYRLGRNLLTTGRISEARKIFRNGFRKNPLHLKNLFRSFY